MALWDWEELGEEVVGDYHGDDVDVVVIKVWLLEVVGSGRSGHCLVHGDLYNPVYLWGRD